MNWFSELMNYRANVGGFLFPELVYFTLIGLLCISILLASIRIFFSKPKQAMPKVKSTVIEEHMVHSLCANCRWEGNLPKFNRRCPRCGQSNFSE